MTRTPKRSLLFQSVLFLAACEPGDQPVDGQPEPELSEEVSRDVPVRDVGADMADDAGQDTSDAGDVEPDPDLPVEPEECFDESTLFETRVWPELVYPRCMGCHTADGAARASGLIFVPRIVPNYLQANESALSAAARVEVGDVSRVLLKPSGRESHGGGEVVREGSPEYRLLEEFVALLDDGFVCPPEGISELGEGVQLLTPQQTFRKAALLLNGRLPTPDEYLVIQAGGQTAMLRALDDLMQEEAFLDRVKEIYNDRLLTDRLLVGTRAIDAVDATRFTEIKYYESIEDENTRNAHRAALNRALARQPLELIAHVVRDGRPFTEILTADYTIVNDFVEYALSASNRLPELDDPLAEFLRTEEIDGVPHAGVLSTHAFLARFPSTTTNRNRHRARIVFDRFLATDILALAERPADPESTAYLNPTLNDPQCTVCHTIMDPVAGLFQDFDNAGRYRPPSNWFLDMEQAGFGGALFTGGSDNGAVLWAAEAIAEDQRFAVATVQTVFRAITGMEPLAPVDLTSDVGENTELLRDAYNDQRRFFETVSQRFIDSGYDFRTVIRELVVSPYFRAVALEDDAPDHAVITAGTAHLLTPEELDRKIDAVTGRWWGARASTRRNLIDTYRLLYGGIDSDTVTRRMTLPNGLMANISQRMGMEVACRNVSWDLTLPAGERRMLPHVDLSSPVFEDGLLTDAADASLRRSIRFLFAQLLNEDFTEDSPDVLLARDFIVETLREGQAAILAGTAAASLPSTCRATTDIFTDAELPDARQTSDDPDYQIRAWMALVAVMLTDYRFLYE